MIAGLIRKALLELRWATLLLALLLVVAEGLLAYVLPVYQQKQLSAVLGQSQLAQSFLKALLGTNAPVAVGPELLQSFPFVHPVILALTWAHAAIACTRCPAGEVDRGTIDLLLGLPVSRRGVFLADFVAWGLTALVVVGAVFGANRAGAAFAPDELASAPLPALIICVNLLVLAFAVAGLSALVSALSDRRGRALTILFVLLLVSFLLNFLAQMWQPASSLGWLSLMDYYRPVFILRDARWPWADLATLLGAGGVCWGVGGVIFARRNLATG